MLKTNHMWTLLKAALIGGSLLCSLSIIALCAQQETAEQSVERVKKAIKNDEWGRAQNGIRHALALKPQSPEANYTLRIQGTVSMGILITEDGDVDSVLVLRGVGHGLDEQAAEMARTLKFLPATRSGKPMPYWMKLNVEFNLR